ncbi:pyridoxal 5'-phosphate synthase glutaminase subunit PdxT [Pseudomonadota bacterium]
MVDSVSIGIIGVQGAIDEHRSMLDQLLNECETSHRFSIHIIRNPSDFISVDGIIIPGGESTTISRMLKNKDLFDDLQQRIKKRSISVMGTCAGCVLLAHKALDTREDLMLLQAMDMEVKRNAFGGQRESFERLIDIKKIGRNYPSVFIRAPVITKVWGSCRVLARIDNYIVMAEDGDFLGISFHPELTEDTRIHRYFLSKVETMKKRVSS